MTVDVVPATVSYTETRHQLSRGEAAQLTDAIRASANRLWILVTVAFERKAWKALGYESWDDYVDAELPIGRSRSYQLVDTGKVMLAIAEAAGVEPETLDPMPARTVAAVKGSLPALRRAIRRAIAEASAHDDYSALETVIIAAVDEVRAATVDTRTVTRNHTATAVACPVCEASGYLGTGKRAQELATRATRWLARLK